MPPDQESHVQSDRIERLRGYRVYKPRVRDLSNDFALIQENLQRTKRSLGSASRAWAACCPDKLLARTGVVSMARGVLTISADDSSTRFELDRWLRSGGEHELITSATTSIRKIKIVVRSKAR